MIPGIGRGCAAGWVARCCTRGRRGRRGAKGRLVSLGARSSSCTGETRLPAARNSPITNRETSFSSCCFSLSPSFSLPSLLRYPTSLSLSLSLSLCLFLSMLLPSLAGLQSLFPSSSPGKIHVTRKSWARREREKPIALYNIARAVPGRRQQEWRTFICIRLDGGSTVERNRGESYDWKMQFTQVFSAFNGWIK